MRTLRPPPPPSELLADIAIFYMYNYMFLKQEKPEMDDFEKKKIWFNRKNT